MSLKKEHSIFSAEILAVGTELLMGQIVNTNACYLAAQLRDLGIDSKYQSVVGDNETRIIDAIQHGLKRSDLLIITGGLGPTEDDISMSCAAKALGLNLAFDQDSWDRIVKHFTVSGREIMASNRKQAMLPTAATILPNDNGTAPGAYITAEFSGKTVHLALLPGPPSENTLMFNRYLKPILREMSGRTIESRFIRLIGIGESQAEARIHHLIRGQTDPTIAPYASEGEVMIRVTTASGLDEASLLEAESRLDQTIAAIRDEIGVYIYHIGEKNLYEVTVDLLKERGLTLAVAESCTAGLLSSKLGDVAGVSSVYLGSVVSYDNRVKTKLLGVRNETLEQRGACSRACAEEMATGVKTLLGSDYSIAITGIAGPDGGSAEKPVGTVHVAVAAPEGIYSHNFVISGNRLRVRTVAALWAANLLRRRILER